MFQELSAKAFALQPPTAPPPRPADEARELIARYPNLSEVELARLINLYRQLSALDTALMLSDESLAPKLDRFSADNRSRIRPPFRHYASLWFYAVLGIGAFTWALAASS
jgi:hypothetical protein